MIWENKIPSQQKPTPLDRLNNRPFMTEVGGLFSQVEPEKIAIDCRQLLPDWRRPTCQRLPKKEACRGGVRGIADVTFERKMNSIFGSINSSSTQLARPLNNKGIGIIVNENYFATR